MHVVFDTLARTVEWFKRAVPGPTTKNFHTQLGVHFEEVNEMLMEISSDDFTTSFMLDQAKDALHNLAVHLKTYDNVVYIKAEDRVNYLDSLCDQIVTASGCAHMAAMDIVAGMVEVNRSNFSKFDESGQPIFDPNMKIMKGQDYSKANLTPYV